MNYFLAFIKFYWLPLLVSALVALMFLVTGCITDVVEPEEVIEPDDLVDIAETYCRSDPTLTCGKVYGFPDTPVENPIGMLELCVSWPEGIDPLRPTLAQAEAEFGVSILSPDPRFANANLCWWQCPSMRGCNSYSGCYCPAVEMPPTPPMEPLPPLSFPLHPKGLEK